ncbi:hypothetical protein [Aureimonas sp. AU20]|uniref:hypothetical protein n=1 Tax=Aureimonas sp. AU20 TaxID=1349819 RepID=UPI00071FFFA7|nr:hypothetical protein [Aureimonas sp. AU20]ALN71146.1 hypothetical protein M673_00385 [Aureimonas sp. AU20]
MASDDLFFLRTGDETSTYVLVRLIGGEGALRAEATLDGAAEGEGVEFETMRGDPPTVLRDANEFALLNGFDLRIDLAGNEWPAELGIIGNK